MKNLTVLFFLASSLLLSGAIPPPIQSNSWSTNPPGTPVIGQDNLSITNKGSTTNWTFFGFGPKTVARLMDVSNIVTVASGAATNAVSQIQSNGVTIASGVTNLNFVDGTNISWKVTNSGAVSVSAHLNPAVTTGASNYTDARVSGLSNALNGAFIANLNGIGTNTTLFSPSGGSGAALTVDTNTLIVTNGFVGIRTAAEGWVLKVQGDIFAKSNIVFDSSGSAYNTNLVRSVIYASGAGGTSYPFLEAGHLILQSRSSGLARDIILLTGIGDSPTNTMVFDRNGRLGINTNFPQARLHVVGSGIVSNVVQIGTTAIDPIAFITTNGAYFGSNGFRLSTNANFEDQEWITEKRLQDVLQAREGATYFLQTNAHPVVAGTRLTQITQGSNQFMTNALSTGSNFVAVWLSTNFVTSGIIPAGRYDLHIHCYKTGGGPDVAIGFDLVRTNGAGIVTLANGETNVVANQVETDFTLSLHLDTAVVVSTTDYIGVRYYAIKSGAAVNLITHVGGTTDSHFSTPNLGQTGSSSVFTVRTNGVSASTTATVINFVKGTNSQVLATNMGSGVVDVAVHITGSSSSGSLSVSSNGTSVVTAATNLNFVNFTRMTNASGNVSIDASPVHSTLTYAGTVTLDFNGDSYKTVSLTGDIIFQTSNLSAGKALAVRVVADGSARTLTFPATWKFLGAAAPSAINASKVAVLSVTSFGTTDADVIAAWGAQP